MKIYIIFLYFILLGSTGRLCAQVQAGEYITNANLDKFEGTWIWQSGNNSITIKLKKVKFKYDDPVYFEDVLFGSHSFVHNGFQIESSLDEFSLVGPLKKSTISLDNDLSGSANLVSGYIKNINLNNKFVRLDMVYVPGTVPQLTWELSEVSYTKVYPETAGFSLPASIILTKQ